MKPKTAKDRNRRNRTNTLMVGPAPMPNQMQSINEYVQSQKMLNDNLQQYQVGQADLNQQLGIQSHIDFRSIDVIDKEEPTLALEREASSKQDQSLLGLAGKPRSSLWKENFKRR